MNKLKLILSAIFICIVIVLVVYLLGKFTTNKNNDTAVIKEIRSLNRLETSSFTIEKIIDKGNSGNIFQNLLFGNRVLLIAHGQVIGGFDLSNLSENSIQTNGKSITVNLPPPQILSVSLDEVQTRVYDRQKGILVNSGNDLESEARVSAVNAIRIAACEGGILASSSENAKKQLESILKSFGFTIITINVPVGNC